MPITARQRKVLDYIKHYFEMHQEAPTMAEIGQEFGMSSSASVHHVVSILEKEGLTVASLRASRPGVLPCSSIRDFIIGETGFPSNETLLFRGAFRPFVGFYPYFAQGFLSGVERGFKASSSLRFRRKVC